MHFEVSALNVALFLVIAGILARVFVCILELVELGMQPLPPPPPPVSPTARRRRRRHRMAFTTPQRQVRRQVQLTVGGLLSKPGDDVSIDLEL